MRFYSIIIVILGLMGCNVDNPSNPQVMDDHSTHMNGLPSLDDYTYADSVNAGLITADSLKGSPRRVTNAQVEDLNVRISYGSPGVRGRVIWGGLVGYDEVWATGAHMATEVEFSKDVLIQDKVVPAGAYAFFTIPGKDEWTLILNSNWDQHLADDYSQDLDVVRLRVTLMKTETMTPRLTYRIVTGQSDDTSEIVMNWEYIQVSLPFEQVL